MYRPGTSISKAKVKSSTQEDGAYAKTQAEKMPTLQDYIKKRDWIGAVALLESERNVNIQVENSLWLAYCYFHMGEYRYSPLDPGNPFTSMMNF
jgi:intraflagellar transport protein 56